MPGMYPNRAARRAQLHHPYLTRQHLTQSVKEKDPPRILLQQIDDNSQARFNAVNAIRTDSTGTGSAEPLPMEEEERLPPGIHENMIFKEAPPNNVCLTDTEMRIVTVSSGDTTAEQDPTRTPLLPISNSSNERYNSVSTGPNKEDEESHSEPRALVDERIQDQDLAEILDSSAGRGGLSLEGRMHVNTANRTTKANIERYVPPHERGTAVELTQLEYVPMSKQSWADICESKKDGAAEVLNYTRPSLHVSIDPSSDKHEDFIQPKIISLDQEEDIDDWHMTEEYHSTVKILSEHNASYEDSDNFLMVKVDRASTATYLKRLISSTMLFYFTERPPSLIGFRSWVDSEIVSKRGWKVRQVKLLGNHFFMVQFLNSTHRQLTMAHSPWFMYNRYVYTSQWTPSFSVQNAFKDFIPTWVELPFRELILENSRREIMGALGTILHYTQGDDLSNYPHDKACILWDLRRPVPKYIKANVDDDIYIYQPVVFSNLSNIGRQCRRAGHQAIECPINDATPRVAVAITHTGAPAPEQATELSITERPDDHSPPLHSLHSDLPSSPSLSKLYHDCTPARVSAERTHSSLPLTTHSKPIVLINPNPTFPIPSYKSILTSSSSSETLPARIPTSPIKPSPSMNYIPPDNFPPFSDPNSSQSESNSDPYQLATPLPFTTIHELNQSSSMYISSSKIRKKKKRAQLYAKSWFSRTDKIILRNSLPLQRQGTINSSSEDSSLEDEIHEGDSAHAVRGSLEPFISK